MAGISGTVDLHHEKHSHLAKNVEDNHSTVASTVGTLLCSIHKGIWISRSGKYFGRETRDCPHCLTDFARTHGGPSEEKSSGYNTTSEAKISQKFQMKESAVDDSVERNILMSFATSCNLRSWRNKHNWGSEKPLCDWYGVATNGDGRVTKLYLRYNNLCGAMPANLAGLNFLTEIEFGFNKFTGILPAEWSTLTHLRFLNLYGSTELTGRVPVSWSALCSLKYCYLNGTGIESTKADIRQVISGLRIAGGSDGEEKE